MVKSQLNSDGLVIPPQDLSTLSPESNDDARLYNHDGSSSITLVGGGTTSQQGYYMWDHAAGAWEAMKSTTNSTTDADTLDSLDSTQFLRSDTADGIGGDLDVNDHDIHSNGVQIYDGVNGYIPDGIIQQANLDADTLDGIHGSGFLRSSAHDTARGVIGFASSGTINGTLGGGNGEVFRVGGTKSDFINSHTGGHGRYAQVWNAYWDGSTSTWRSIVGSEPHAMVGWLSGAPGSGVSSGTLVFATAGSNASAGDAITWNYIEIEQDGSLDVKNGSVQIGGNTVAQSVAASGQTTLSGGTAVVTTGISAVDATFTLALGVDDPAADCKVTGRLFWDDSAGVYKVQIVEDGTSVGNPTVNYDVIRVR